MKKNVLIFGLISGAIVSSFMFLSTSFCGSDAGMWIGYSSMLLAFIFIFVGIKNYRDKYNGGSIGFGKAFRIGLYISLIASTMYVITWLINYYCFVPDFMDQYAAHTLDNMTKNGATPAELAAKTEEMNQYKEWYKNPLLVILLTYTEIVPVGIVVSLIAALILKRKPQPPAMA